MVDKLVNMDINFVVQLNDCIKCYDSIATIAKLVCLVYYLLLIITITSTTNGKVYNTH